MIPVDDSVRLLNAVMERMNYSKLRAAYSRIGRIERDHQNIIFLKQPNEDRYTFS